MILQCNLTENYENYNLHDFDAILVVRLQNKMATQGNKILLLERILDKCLEILTLLQS